MFIAEEVAVSLVAKLRGPLGQMGRVDRNLADQARRAATSVALNISEGAARQGRDRAHCFRIADGSARELAMALRLADAWGYVEPTALVDARADLDRLRGLLWGLTHR